VETWAGAAGKVGRPGPAGTMPARRAGWNPAAPWDPIWGPIPHIGSAGPHKPIDCAATQHRNLGTGLSDVVAGNVPRGPWHNLKGTFGSVATETRQKGLVKGTQADPVVDPWHARSCQRTFTDLATGTFSEGPCQRDLYRNLPEGPCRRDLVTAFGSLARGRRHWDLATGTLSRRRCHRDLCTGTFAQGPLPLEPCQKSGCLFRNGASSKGLPKDQVSGPLSEGPRHRHLVTAPSRGLWDLATVQLHRGLLRRVLVDRDTGPKGPLGGPWNVARAVPETAILRGFFWAIGWHLVQLLWAVGKGRCGPPGGLV